MKREKFNISINAPREKVWKVLWDDASYRDWTSFFMEGSHAETDWKEGSKVHFLSPDGGGMLSRIESKIPYEYMSFKHLGVVKGGVEDTDSDEATQWSGAFENYTLKGVNGKTELTVDMDIVENYREYFLKTWPVALERVKALAENS